MWKPRLHLAGGLRSSGVEEGVPSPDTGKKTIDQELWPKTNEAILHAA